MRDLHAAEDLQAEMIKTPVVLPKAGMRHSIRPRRALIEAMDAQDIDQQDTARVLPARVKLQPSDIRQPAVPKSYAPDTNLPRWHELDHIEPGTSRKDDTALPVVDASRDSASVRAFDQLRTRLRQITQEHGWTNIGITTPTSGCGNTFTAMNLALSLSRVKGSRTVLMDFNLRRPGIAKAFDITPRGSMRDFLMGHAPIGDHMIKVSETLALGLNNCADPEAAETLQSPETAHTMERMRAALQPEIVLYDMPAMLTHDDVSAYLPQLDGVLLVSDGTQTMGRELMECERMLNDQVPLLGVVLNRARADSIQRYS
ncbi:CpsD/CapB family tyrosine-protein kinase [Sulfitobacter geojensis]|uniref:CpsD/CapB family tyrosine-protein kinase n=1 Tax=Sulfitobacter geojensis TaxID=1342299 RepID=A0AAE3B5B3_9RHOB|nr:CpsD/CapB family tyrosine-protein kinase [Sulfitobacter geojensis]MBM1687755.1 CpsD/CapB family tyrosine-protein kinase [Sulfitobacter geojensis]MBM1691822.1 CpsD/CapB family tyrosine-protein kinase [Sulfitobacter geojensis]MBM1703988.1 CpsD/CapB family tyrosine-protein kinase [Sulfitobacter geojensis]MBM1708046.1 CpsD/CapB family tyrosine-protein kinase [Sulfitobacter geojensis]MBM1712111.1 CpsD/CapB family tyrosine-protein kinase [Sulfitobacter geojensis]